MYRSSQLEYVAQSASSSVSYSTATPVRPNQTMGYGGFVTAITNFDYHGVDNSFAQTYIQHPLPKYFAQQKSHFEYNFLPDNFLIPGKGGKFVGEAEEVREFVEKTFQKMFNKPFPTDIKVSVLNSKRFRKIAPYPSTIGLSVNRSKLGLLSEIFILNDNIAKVMLTIGHELGHVLTGTLEDPKDEEAKAYAFSLAWMKVIKENNIANLGNAYIFDNPAANGLHDVAFEFVLEEMKNKSAWEVYLKLIGKNIFSPEVFKKRVK